jgi:hypothetical protein
VAAKEEQHDDEEERTEEASRMGEMRNEEEVKAK